MKKLLLVLTVLSLTGCAAGGRSVGIRVQGGLAHPHDLQDGSAAAGGAAEGYAADGYTVVVKRYGDACKPEYLSGVMVTCEAAKPTPHTIIKPTEAGGAAFFSVRGAARFWVDYGNNTYAIGNVENSDTVPNQNIIEFAVPGGNAGCGGAK